MVLAKKAVFEQKDPNRTFFPVNSLKQSQREMNKRLIVQTFSRRNDASTSALLMLRPPFKALKLIRPLSRVYIHNVVTITKSVLDVRTDARVHLHTFAVPTLPHRPMTYLL